MLVGVNEDSYEDYDVISHPGEEHGKESFGHHYSEEHKQQAPMMTRMICIHRG